METENQQTSRKEQGVMRISEELPTTTTTVSHLTPPSTPNSSSTTTIADTIDASSSTMINDNMEKEKNNSATLPPTDFIETANKNIKDLMYLLYEVFGLAISSSGLVDVVGRIETFYLMTYITEEMHKKASACWMLVRDPVWIIIYTLRKHIQDNNDSQIQAGWDGLTAGQFFAGLPITLNCEYYLQIT